MLNIRAETLIDIIGDLYTEETSIVLSDTKNYLYYRPSERIDLKIKPGDPVVEGTITAKALKLKQKVSEYIDRDVFGVPYYGMAVPYKQIGRIAGCVTAVFPALSDALSVVTVQVADGWIPMPFEDILYIEAKNRKTYVIGKNTSGTHRNSLNEFDFFLPRDRFIRCHRSFVINIHHIEAIYPNTHSTFELKMKNGAKIPVSQTHSSYFRKLLGF